VTDPGRLFMFGVYGTKPSRETVALFKATNATGVLLLARNIETPAQTKAYVEELEQRVGRPLLVAVDHEGGWVLRFKSGMTAFPGNAALGRARDPELAYAVGRQMARELAPLGVRMNLAPVLDVETDAYNPGIGIRSFGPDPRLAGRLGAAFIRGMQEHGVSACAKHFPGKGAATVDAHVDLPTIKLPRAAFARTHLEPFRDAVRAGVDAVMTSHVRFPAFDSVPATFSAKIVRGVLRGTLGYDGLVVSDDLCMGAITKRWPVAEATLKCLDAGHDVLMIAHDLQGMRDAVELLREAGADETQVAAADARIERLLPRRRVDHAPNLDEGLTLARRIAAAAVTVVRRGALKLPVPVDRGTLILIPDFRQVRERFTFENGPGGPEALLRRLARGAAFARTPVETTALGALASAVRRAERVVFFCFEARRFPGQAAALKLLSRSAAKKTAAVLIRSSRDLDLCPAAMTVADSAGYRAVSLESAASLVLEKNQ
jgi:beta-N-acetylhexosaminidase